MTGKTSSKLSTLFSTVIIQSHPSPLSLSHMFYFVELGCCLLVGIVIMMEYRMFCQHFDDHFLLFHFISTNNPYAMNYRFIAADTLQKIMVLVVLAIWSRISSRRCLEWSITLFSLSTLPNTLVMGISLLKGMYGKSSGTLMVQVVVLQCIMWYTLMLFLFEYREAKLLILEQFPNIVGSIISFRIDSDINSLDGKGPLQTEAEVGEDGKLQVIVRKSTNSRSKINSQ